MQLYIANCKPVILYSEQVYFQEWLFDNGYPTCMLFLGLRKFYKKMKEVPKTRALNHGWAN